MMTSFNSRWSRVGALLLLVAATACSSSVPSDSTQSEPGSGTDGLDSTATQSASATASDDSTEGSDTASANASDATDDASDATRPVSLGSAGTFAILAKSAISNVPDSAISGDIAVSPAAATFITGLSLVVDSSSAYWTSSQVTGKVYAADDASPTPVNLTAAIGDMELAFAEAAGRAADFVEVGAGDIGGMTLEAGVYKWGTSLVIPTDVTLTGTANDVWIFQIAQGLTMSSATRVGLAGGARAKNVFWQVAGSVELDTTAHCEGVILAQTDIVLRTGASVSGRLFAQTAVTLDGNTVSEPAE